MAKYQPKNYSVSRADNLVAGWLFDYDWYSLDELRSYLIRHAAGHSETYVVHAMYNIKRDGRGDVQSYNRYPIGELKIGKDKVTWKSKRTGKTYKVNPKTGGI